MDDIEKVFYTALMRMLGYDPDTGGKAPPVRMSWPQSGQPDWTQRDSVVFVQCTYLPGEEVSIPIHDVWYDDSHSEDLQLNKEHTRVLRLSLVAYGPRCVEDLYRIRTLIYGGWPEIKEAGIYIVPGPEAPQYAPELFGGVWWPRADMALTFNVHTVYETKVRTIQHVQVAMRVNERGSDKVWNDDFIVHKGGKS